LSGVGGGLICYEGGWKVNDVDKIEVGNEVVMVVDYLEGYVIDILVFDWIFSGE